MVSLGFLIALSAPVQISCSWRWLQAALHTSMLTVFFVSPSLQNKRYAQALELAKKDKLYKDAISTAATSQDPAIVDSLLKFFVEEKLKECFAATLFMCYDYVHPDLVMELAWRNDIMDFAMPYFIQVMGEFKIMRHQLKEMAVALTQIMTGGAAPQAAPAQQAPPPQQQAAPPQQAAAPQEAAGFGFIG